MLLLYIVEKYYKMALEYTKFRKFITEENTYTQRDISKAIKGDDMYSMYLSFYRGLKNFIKRRLEKINNENNSYIVECLMEKLLNLYYFIGDFKNIKINMRNLILYPNNINKIIKNRIEYKNEDISESAIYWLDVILTYMIAIINTLSNVLNNISERFDDINYTFDDFIQCIRDINLKIFSRYIMQMNLIPFDIDFKPHKNVIEDKLELISAKKCSLLLKEIN